MPRGYVDSEHRDSAIESTREAPHRLSSADRISASVQAFVREFGCKMISVFPGYGEMRGAFESYQSTAETVNIVKGSKEVAHVCNAPGIPLKTNSQSVLDPSGGNSIVAPCYLAQYLYTRRNKVHETRIIPFAQDFAAGDLARINRRPTNLETFTFQVEETEDIWTLDPHQYGEVTRWKVDTHYAKKPFFVDFHNPHRVQIRPEGNQVIPSVVSGDTV